MFYHVLARARLRTCASESITSAIDLHSRVTNMQVGEVRIADDGDFEAVKKAFDCDDGWQRVYAKSGVNVWTKSAEGTEFIMIKVSASFSDVKPSVVYDVMHDFEYRKHWDRYMLDSYAVGHLNPNNDVRYFAVRCPSPMRNRDFVVQRAWLETEKEYMIISHSIFHESVPLRKSYIRGVIYMNGFIIRPSAKGCTCGYIAHSDLKGSLPTWLVNKTTQVMAGKMVKRLHNACLRYESWKCKHDPHLKPWIYPEQLTTLKIVPSQCLKEDVHKSTESLEECEFQECDIAAKEFDDDDDDTV